MKKIRSNRSSRRAWVSSAPPSTTATASGSRYRGTRSAIRAEVWRRDLRRLQDRRVAAGQGADQGARSKLDGVVPGADDEDHAEGVVGRPGPPGLGQERRVLPLRLHPPVEVLQGIVDLRDHEADLGEVAFEPGLAEIGPQRLVDRGLLLLQEPLQGLELRATPRTARVRPLRKLVLAPATLLAIPALVFPVSSVMSASRME